MKNGPLSRLRNMISNVEAMLEEVDALPGSEAQEIVGMLNICLRSLRSGYSELESWPEWMGDVVEMQVSKLETSFASIGGKFTPVSRASLH